jgi:hypothetical protein
MNTTGTSSTAVPIHSDRPLLRTAFIVDAVLWLAVGGFSRLRALHADGEDWELPYALFSVFLIISAAASTFTVLMYTSKSGPRSTSRIAAIALAIVGVVSTVMAWAFPLWAVLLAAGFAALAVTGSPQTRSAIRLSGALLVGLAVAFIALTAKIGPPGEYNDHSEAQSWGVTVACGLTAIVLAMLARRTLEAHSGPRAETHST